MSHHLELSSLTAGGSMGKRGTRGPLKGRDGEFLDPFGFIYLSSTWL